VGVDQAGEFDHGISIDEERAEAVAQAKKESRWKRLSGFPQKQMMILKK
jgi:hypothetical protein